MALVAVPDHLGVLLLTVHLGLSVGWHIGKGMTRYNEQRKQGTGVAILLRRFFWTATHHYDMGIAVATVGVALLTTVPRVDVVVGWLLVGFGVGMAYDDRKDHPPEGMLRTIVDDVRRSGPGGVDV